MDAELGELIRLSPLFGGASAEVAERLLAASRIQSYAKGAAVFHQGDPAMAIGLVVSGWMKLFRMSAGGNEAVVRMFSAGESFGEAVALRGTSYPASGGAVTDCRVLWINAEHLRRQLRDSPDLALAILASTFVHLHDLVNQIEQLKSQNGGQRVAEFLLGICETSEGPATIRLPYDKVVIAGLLGIKPESLSRAFARLRDFGVVIRGNELDIADVGILRSLASDSGAG